MSSDRRDTTFEVFLSYSHRDEDLRDELEVHLASLRKEGSIRTWHAGLVGAGKEPRSEIDRRLAAADLLFLLVSPDYVASGLLNEVQQAQARRLTSARVIPILLRPTTWTNAPFSDLQILPRNGKAVTLWPDRDLAWLEVTRGVSEVIEDLRRWSREAEPRYPDEHTRELSRALEEAYRREEELISRNQDTTTLRGEILDLRRKIREGGQLKAGDFLLDGRFRLLDPIGRGGFATVWKASDKEQRALVAVKVLHGQYAHDQTRRERFFRGSRKMSELHHQGIVRVIEEKCEDGGYFFFVMEYVGGGDFRQAVLSKRLTLEERLRVVLEVGEALRFAHNQEVVHRDIKPANVLLDEAGSAKLTDFDLVRAVDTTGGTRTQGMLGTFLYSAPEVLGNPKEANAQADLFSLGMTAVFAVAGKDLPAEVWRDARSFIEGLECSTELKSILAQSVAWEVKERPGSVEEFCRALKESFSDESGTPRTDPLPPGGLQQNQEAVSDESESARMAPLPPESQGISDESRAPRTAPMPLESLRRNQGTVSSRLRIGTLLALLLSVAGYFAWPFFKAEKTPSASPGATPSASAFGEVSDPQTLPGHCQRAQQLTGIELVYVSGGWYVLGADDLERDPDWIEGVEDWAKPVHRVHLSPFWIGKTEVTHAQYGRFLAENQDRPDPEYWDDPSFNDPQQPVVGVSWLDALAFSRWAGFDLPTEAEWEAAARGKDERRFPWDDAEPNANLANFGGGSSQPVKVGSYPAGAGPFGTLDQAGNVWEWCWDEFDANAYQHRDGQSDPIIRGNEGDENALRVLRGGSWFDPALDLLAAVRPGLGAWSRYRDLGFRVVCRFGPEHGD